MRKLRLSAMLAVVFFVPIAGFAATTTTTPGTGAAGSAPKPVPTLGPPLPPSGVAAANCGPLTNGLSEVRGTAPVVDLDDVYEATSVFIVPHRPAVATYIGALRYASQPEVINPEFNIANAYIAIADGLKYAHPAPNGAFDCVGVTSDLAIFDVVATTYEKDPVGTAPAQANKEECYPTQSATPPPCLVVKKYWYQYKLNLIISTTSIPPFTGVGNGWCYIGSQPPGYKPRPDGKATVNPNSSCPY